MQLINVWAGRPKKGPEFEQKRLANASYKSTVFTSENEQVVKADLKMENNNVTDFWKLVKILNNC